MRFALRFAAAGGGCAAAAAALFPFASSPLAASAAAGQAAAEDDDAHTAGPSLLERRPPGGVYDVGVVGGGVVGLAVARELAVRGASVVLIEREDTFAAGASSGNSGLGCTGYDAPPGSLERRLLRRSIQRHPSLYRSFGLSYDHVRKSGSLVVAWTPEELEKLPAVLEENREAGDEEAEILGRDELLELEPGLSPAALGAVLCPREAVVEPWLVPVGYEESARLHGAALRPATEVVAAAFDASARLWRVATRPSAANQSGRSRPGELLVRASRREEGSGSSSNSSNNNNNKEQTFKARILINCAGLYGDVVERIRASDASAAGGGGGVVVSEEGSRDSNRSGGGGGDGGGGGGGDDASVNFSLTPRKGQFVVFGPPAPTSRSGGGGGGESISRAKINAPEEEQQEQGREQAPAPAHIIEPVATLFTKGVIAWETVYGNIIVGPTAEPQQDREDRATDAATIARLRAYGERAVPAVRGMAVLGTYSGLRPATEHRDYQIKAFPRQNWVTVAGIRSTGLTGAAGIGEYVAELWEAVAAREEPYRPPRHASDRVVGVTAAASTNQAPLAPSPRVLNSRVPPLEVLADDYARRGDGTVQVYERRGPQRVTHPISSFGMETLSRRRQQQHKQQQQS